ncbi:hypothetical protein QBC44DRAFT_339942 [Cladorrhinum sp. PSN332]|nr:hypothetical protein QBC44DRAFT_339942 [Cladorrhinum sp. PSN332]
MSWRAILGSIWAANFTACRAIPGTRIRHTLPGSDKFNVRQTSQLRSSYDFVIVGGGTSGLTVADRLTEAFSRKTVLVIEYGQLEEAPGFFEPPGLWQAPQSYATLAVYSSLPTPEMNNKITRVVAGTVVGGGAAVNGQFLDRPSGLDLDSWVEFAGRGYKGWGWKRILPFFKKSVTSTEPSPAQVARHGYTWGLSAYGGNTPIYASYPDFQWGDVQVLNRTWSNYDLLVRHQVTRVVYPKNAKSGPPKVEIKSLADGTVFTVTAKAEVILSAGALSTPLILQQSGIGPKSFLKSANIPLTIDLPGVGSNLQDHGGLSMYWNYTSPPATLSPSPSDMLDPAFHANATSDWNSNPATGPYTLERGNTALYLSLPHTSPKTYKSLTSQIRSSVSSAPDPSQIPRQPQLPNPALTTPGVLGMNLHPLSRGTVRFSTSNPLGAPIIDVRGLSNPLDLDIYLEITKYLRKIITTPTMQSFGAYESSPGPVGIGEDDDEALKEWIKDALSLSYAHPCCTAALGPKAKGGVVGADLKVHGASGLRVVDMSVLPMVPSTHLSATAHAIGEKGADLIAGEWRGR